MAVVKISEAACGLWELVNCPGTQEGTIVTRCDASEGSSSSARAAARLSAWAGINARPTSAATINNGRLGISAPIRSPVPDLETFTDRQLWLSQVHGNDEAPIREPVAPLTGRLGREQARVARRAVQAVLGPKWHVLCAQRASEEHRRALAKAARSNRSSCDASNSRMMPPNVPSLSLAAMESGIPVSSRSLMASIRSLMLAEE